MIVFGTCVGYSDKLAMHTAPGLARSMGHHSYIHICRASNGKDIFPVYAEIMKRARSLNAEALVLIHDDLEFRDQDLAAKIREVVKLPELGIAGLIGARGVKSLRWWDGDRRGHVEDLPYGEHDFGFDGGDCTVVDSVDGMCLILSPWAIEHLQVDGLGYTGFHGYDAEMCFQARKARKRVMVANINAFHHTRGGVTGPPETANAAEANFQARWFA